MPDTNPSTLSVAVRPSPVGHQIQPYIRLLYEAVAEHDVALSTFSLRDLLINPPDVAHFHWPGLWKVRPHRGLAALAVLWQAKLRGTRIALTVHNAKPHEQPKPFHGWWLKQFDKLVDTALVLSEASRIEVEAARPHLRPKSWHHTRHGILHPAYPEPPSVAESRRRLEIDDRPTVGFVGQIRPYKQVPKLLQVLASTGLQVVVGGKCSSTELEDSVRQAAQGLDAHLLLRELSAEEVSLRVRACDLLVLPYSMVLNSGSAILGLGLETPILVPKSDVFLELSSEVGPGWVNFFEPPLTPDDIHEALGNRPTQAPDLKLFQWDAVGKATYDALRYGEAAGNRLD